MYFCRTVLSSNYYSHNDGRVTELKRERGEVNWEIYQAGSEEDDKRLAEAATMTSVSTGLSRIKTISLYHHNESVINTYNMYCFQEGEKGSINHAYFSYINY